MRVRRHKPVFEHARGLFIIHTPHFDVTLLSHFALPGRRLLASRAEVMVAKKLKIPNIGGAAKPAQAMKLVQAKTKRGRRILDARAPKAVSASSIALYALHTCIVSSNRQ